MCIFILEQLDAHDVRKYHGFVNLELIITLGSKKKTALAIRRLLLAPALANILDAKIVKKCRRVIEDFAEYLEYTIEKATQSHGKLLLPWLHEERTYIAHLAAAAYTTTVSHGQLYCGRAFVLCQTADLAIEQPTRQHSKQK